MNDANRKLLDSSIIEPMPPFPSVDDMIAGERRRLRLRRAVGVIGVAAAVAGLVFGIQAGLGGSPTGGPPVQPGQSSGGGTGAPTNEPRTVEATAARLSEALANRLSTVVPNATYGPAAPHVAVDTVDGYTGFATSMSVTRPQGTGTVELLALWPEARSGPAPTGLDLMGGCGALLVNAPEPTNSADWQCETRTEADGTLIVLGHRRDGANLVYIVAVRYFDSLVRITAANNPTAGMDAPVLSLDDLRRIVSDGSVRP